MANIQRGMPWEIEDGYYKELPDSSRTDLHSFATAVAISVTGVFYGGYLAYRCVRQYRTS